MKTKITIAIIILFIIGVIVVVMQSGRPSTYAPYESINNDPNIISTSTPVTSPVATSTTSYTMDDIAKHNSATSCWTTIDGIVYDVTSWINRHPGGPQAILSLCGKDGSPAFKNQHEGEPKPAMMLATFKIGVLK